MTGEWGWVQPPDAACTMPCGMDRMRRAGAETSTDPAPSGAFCFLALILTNKVAQRPGQPLGQGPGAPADGAAQPETHAVLPPAPAWWEVLVWALGCGWRRGLAPVLAGQAGQGREKYTLFIFWFC